LQTCSIFPSAKRVKEKRVGKMLVVCASHKSCFHPSLVYEEEASTRLKRHKVSLKWPKLKPTLFRKTWGEADFIFSACL
jgi:hypothetical protein